MTQTTSLANNLGSHICRSMDAGLACERTSHRAFVGVSALLFATSAALTIVWWASMSAMRGIAKTLPACPTHPLCGDGHNASGKGTPALSETFADARPTLNAALPERPSYCFWPASRSSSSIS